MNTTPIRPSPASTEVTTELERLVGEIRLKLHLASLDAKEMWETKLEPKVFELRTHLKEAREHPQQTTTELLESLRKFAAGL